MKSKNLPFRVVRFDEVHGMVESSWSGDFGFEVGTLGELIIIKIETDEPVAVYAQGSWEYVEADVQEWERTDSQYSTVLASCTCLSCEAARDLDN
jgi:hypothetical protein